MIPSKNQNQSLGFADDNRNTKPVPFLSKFQLLAYRQCQCSRRLWLEVNHADAKADSSVTQASSRMGHQVGDIARQLYDPTGCDHLIDSNKDGFEQALSQSQHWPQQADAPVFEMWFRAAGVLAFADVMLPVQTEGDTPAWRMGEVKSSTSVKSYHREDITIQTHVARQAGVAVQSVALAHIDSNWTYPGNGNYDGLLTEVDLTADASDLEADVISWISDAAEIVTKKQEPACATGSHCFDPFECGFHGHCTQGEPHYQHPIAWVPKSTRSGKPTECMRWISVHPPQPKGSQQLRLRRDAEGGCARARGWERGYVQSSFERPPERSRKSPEPASFSSAPLRRCVR